MSFSNNCKADKIPGPIKGNPIQGLCEKASIQVDKIFDACMKQETFADVEALITNVTPGDLIPPFTFVSAKSISTAAPVEGLVVSELPDCECCARVTANVVIPLQVVLIDSTGRQGVATAAITIPKDVVMHISAPSVIPFEIVATASAVAAEGVFVSNSVVRFSLCTTLILKVVMPVQLLVPSYGYTYIPPCQEFTEEVCEGLYDLPLYPADCGADNRCNPDKC